MKSERMMLVVPALGLVICMSFLSKPALGAELGDPRAQAGDDSWNFRAGGMVRVEPKYEGSDEYRVFGLPFLRPEVGDNSTMGFIKNHVSVNGPDDVRFKVLDLYGFHAGPLAGFSFGREEDDGDKLLGIGDVDNGLIVGGYATYRWRPFLFDVSYHHQVTGDVDGGQLRFGLGANAPVTEWLILSGRVGASYADENYVDAYFGISRAQAASSVSGLPAFKPEAGIKDVNVEIGAQIQLGEDWTLSPKLRYSRLIGDAADSPVIDTQDQFRGMLGLTYRFSWQ